MINIKICDIKQLEDELKTLKERAFPFAVKFAVNGVAFKAQKIARERLRRDFIIRNRFTENGIRVNPARSLDVRRQEAVVGSISKYMETQEFGGVKSKRGEYGSPIPTSYSAGESEKSKPRRKLPRRANLMRSIRLNRRMRSYKSKKQEAFAAVVTAVKTNRKFIFLDLVRTRGIFKVTGGSKKPKIKMVYDLTHASIRIKPRPWLRPSVKEASKKMPGIYFRALGEQIKRQKLFKKK